MPTINIPPSAQRVFIGMFFKLILILICPEHACEIPSSFARLSYTNRLARDLQHASASDAYGLANTDFPSQVYGCLS